MEVETALIIYAYLKYRRGKLKKTNHKVVKERIRRWWVHPLNSTRLQDGAFYTLYNKLRLNDKDFFDYFRMKQSTYDELFSIMKESLTMKQTLMRDAIPPEEMFAATMRYLGSTDNLRALHRSFRIGRSTLCVIIRRVCSKISEVLYEKCMPTLDQETWREIALGFEEHANFPHCIGGIAGKQLRVSRSMNGVIYNIVLIIVADTKYRILNFDVATYAKGTDCTVFANTDLYKKLQQGELNIPDFDEIPGIPIQMPYFFAADEAFKMRTNVLRPFGSCSRSQRDMKNFNYRLKLARNYVECTSAILTNKWKIFNRPFDVDVDKAIEIIKCCCLLHNFILKREGYNFEDTLVINGFESMNIIDDSIKSSKTISVYRNALVKYFASDIGRLSWLNYENI